jgi:hypothetical protein
LRFCQRACLSASTSPARLASGSIVSFAIVVSVQCRFGTGSGAISFVLQLKLSGAGIFERMNLPGAQFRLSFPQHQLDFAWPVLAAPGQTLHRLD